MRQSRRLYIILTILKLLLYVQGADKYTDENRPYEFGFTIDGEQHRHEKKDENGIIMGEFGFITADGVYHVTVYATDENGNFKILSMKNIRMKPYPTAPSGEKKGHSLPFPPSQQAPVPQAPLPQAPASVTIQKPLSREPPGKSCSHCSIPTTPPKLTDIAVVSKDRPSYSSGGQGSLSPGNRPSNYPGANQQSGQNPQQDQNYPQGGQNVPQHVGQQYPQQGGQNYPQQGGQNRPQQGGQNYPQQGDQNRPQLGGQTYPQQGGQNRPQLGGETYPQQGGQNRPQQGADNYPHQGGQQGGQNYPQQGGQQGGQNYPQGGNQNRPKPGQTLEPPRGVPGERTPKELEGSSPSNFGSGGQNVPGRQNSPQGTSGPKKPTLISAQMQIVDKNTDIHHLGAGEKEGLPNGLTKDDMTLLLYTFNYTVGFHGHFEEGYTNGAKQGYYFVTGRNGVRTRVDYVADEKGFRPKITEEVLDLLSDDVPKPETEKDEKYGLKGYEFKWLYYPTESH